MLLAPISLKCNIKCVRVSLCVEPGKGSAVLKFGFRRTSFPFTGFTPKISIALLIPELLSEVLTRATVVFFSAETIFDVAIMAISLLPLDILTIALFIAVCLPDRGP
jgi:hypothetical protein